MGHYDYTEEVKKKLGKDNFDIMLREVNKARISAKQMKDICAQLHPEEVGGNHQRRWSTRQGAPIDGPEWREILSDWYAFSAFDLRHDEAVERLINALKHHNLGKILIKRSKWMTLKF